METVGRGTMASTAKAIVEDEADEIGRIAGAMSQALRQFRERLVAPGSRKALRSFSSGDVARMLGVSDGTLRQLSLDGVGPRPETAPNGRRLYSLEQINALRRHFAETKPQDARRLVPHRRPGEALSVVALSTFKGGSGKTTQALALAQYLALRGYRVLAVDLDPQASLTSMLGIQPEYDLGEGDSLYGVIRYEDPRPMRAVVRPTYFAGLDVVPAAVELQEWEHEVPAVLGQPAAVPFFRKLSAALAEVEDAYDVVVIDCPPQLGFLTLSALVAANGLVVPCHPAMLDVMSLSQFLLMASDLMAVVRRAGARDHRDFIRFLLTRHDPNDQAEVGTAAMMRTMLGERVMTRTVLKSAAISAAGMEQKSVYEMDRSDIVRATFDRALESMDGVNAEILGLIHAAWGRGP